MEGTAKIKLISEADARGTFGERIPNAETYKEVYAEIRPVTREEWASAGKNNIKAEMRIDVYAFEYSGEVVIEYNGIKYAVYRTYERRDDDIIELYCELQEGVTYDA